MFGGVAPDDRMEFGSGVAENDAVTCSDAVSDIALPCLDGMIVETSFPSWSCLRMPLSTTIVIVLLNLLDRIIVEHENRDSN